MLMGALMLTFFFVLSGFALSSSAFKHHSSKPLLATACKRYFRLCPPIVALQVLFWLCFQFHRPDRHLVAKVAGMQSATRGLWIMADWQDVGVLYSSSSLPSRLADAFIWTWLAPTMFRWPAGVTWTLGREFYGSYFTILYALASLTVVRINHARSAIVLYHLFSLCGLLWLSCYSSFMVQLCTKAAFHFACGICLSQGVHMNLATMNCKSNERPVNLLNTLPPFCDTVVGLQWRCAMAMHAPMVRLPKYLWDAYCLLQSSFWLPLMTRSVVLSSCRLCYFSEISRSCSISCTAFSSPFLAMSCIGIFSWRVGRNPSLLHHQRCA